MLMRRYIRTMLVIFYKLYAWQIVVNYTHGINRGFDIHLFSQKLPAVVENDVIRHLQQIVHWIETHCHNR